MDLSIVIVNWNTGPLLADCVRSVYAETKCSFEIIIVDNASSDESIASVEREFKGVHIVKSPENEGFSRGNNRGVKDASGDYVVLLNPDTVVLAGALDKLLAKMRSFGADAGIVGPRLLNADRSLQRQQGCRFPTAATSFFQYFFLSHALHIPGIFMNYEMPEGPVDWVCGACLACPRELYKKMDGLDGRIFLYAEDMDFCYRAKKAGYGVLYYPGAEIMHISGQSISKQDRSVFRHQIDGLKDFYKTRHNGFSYFIFKGILFSGIFARYFISAIRGQKDKAKHLKELLGYVYV